MMEKKPRSFTAEDCPAFRGFFDQGFAQIDFDQSAEYSAVPAAETRQSSHPGKTAPVWVQKPAEAEAPVPQEIISPEKRLKRISGEMKLEAGLIRRMRCCNGKLDEDLDVMIDLIDQTIIDLEAAEADEKRAHDRKRSSGSVGSLLRGQLAGPEPPPLCPLSERPAG